MGAVKQDLLEAMTNEELPAGWQWAISLEPQVCGWCNEPIPPGRRHTRSGDGAIRCGDECLDAEDGFDYQMAKDD